MLFGSTFGPNRPGGRWWSAMQSPRCWAKTCYFFFGGLEAAAPFVDADFATGDLAGPALFGGAAFAAVTFATAAFAVSATVFAASFTVSFAFSVALATFAVLFAMTCKPPMPRNPSSESTRNIPEFGGSFGNGGCPLHTGVSAGARTEGVEPHAVVASL